MTGTNCDLFTHNQSRSYLNHLVFGTIFTEQGNLSGIPSTLYSGLSRLES
jgi:hypothetical protein